MPADEFIFIAVRFLLNAVIEEEQSGSAFDLSHQRLDDMPQVGAAVGRSGEESGHLIMTDFAVKQP